MRFEAPVLIALAPLMLFGARPPLPPAETIWVSLCLGDARMPMSIPRKEEAPSPGQAGCHGAPLVSTKKSLPRGPA